MKLKSSAAVNREVDMCEGPILKKLIVFALPLMATNVLQVLFNAADVSILGIFIKDVSRANAAVAAVGATSSLINLLVSLMVGLSVGANVVLSRCVGTKDAEKAARTVGTSVALSLLSGVAVLLVGFFFSRQFLIWMNCDPEVIDMATLYLKIYFLGMPVIMLYNFVSSLLRAVGNTMKCFIYLVIGGVLNIGLNIFSVAVLDKDVEGVALATVISQAVAAILSFIALLKSKGYSRLYLKKIRFYKKELKDIVLVGLPAGIHGCVFAISNIFVQSAVNVYGKIHMAGYAISVQIDTIFYQALNGIAVASLTFVSQNLGAQKTDRIKKTVLNASLLVVVLGAVLGAVMGCFGREICSLLSKDAEVIEIGYRRLLIVGVPYLLCGLMEVMSNTMRGLGSSFSAMMISIFGNCVVRIVWLQTVYRLVPVYDTILWVFPVSWVITLFIYYIYYGKTIRKLEKKIKTEKEQQV